MSEYKSIEQVFDEFKSKELEYIDAIQILQDQFNMEPKEAEALVEAWEN